MPATTMTDDQAAACGEYFLKMEETIESMCEIFVAQFRHWDFEEIYSEALLAFAQSFSSYDPKYEKKRMDRKRYTEICIWRALSVLNQQLYTRHKIMPRVTMRGFEDRLLSPEEESEPVEIESDNPDVSFVMSLIFDTPKDLRDRITEQGDETPDNQAVRRGLRQYLREDLKWSKYRIQKSFRSIRSQVYHA